MLGYGVGKQEGHKFMLVSSSVASRFVVFTEGTHMCTECSDFIRKKVLAIHSTFHVTRFYTFMSEVGRSRG